jgi:hypothetical protein
VLGRYYVTCTGKTDGGGAQVHAVCSTLAYAHHFGISYVHSPFKRIKHNANTDPEQTARWERSFSLGYGEKQIDDLNLAKMEVVPLTEATRLWKIAPFTRTLLVAKHCHWFTDTMPRAYEAIRLRLIEKYRRTGNVAPRRGVALTVAVHVRRGDVTQFKMPKRFTSDEVIVRQLEQIKTAIGARAHEMHLYSEGATADFEIFRDRYKVILHLNEDIFQTLDEMINADVLVMAKSSLSYVAGLISNGIKIYSRFAHTPLSDWVVCDEDGSIPTDSFAEMLAALNTNREKSAAAVGQSIP